MVEGFRDRISGKRAGKAVANTMEAKPDKENGGASTMRLVVYIPASAEEARKAADAVKAGTGVILNAEYLEETIRRRVIDFLDGAVYVLGGDSRRIADSVQLYTPPGVDVADESVLRYGGRPIGDGR